jgi:hypothetical protein
MNMQHDIAGVFNYNLLKTRIHFSIIACNISYFILINVYMFYNYHQPSFKTNKCHSRQMLISIFMVFDL